MQLEVSVVCTLYGSWKCGVALVQRHGTIHVHRGQGRSRAQLHEYALYRGTNLAEEWLEWDLQHVRTIRQSSAHLHGGLRRGAIRRHSGTQLVGVPRHGLQRLHGLAHRVSTILPEQPKLRPEHGVRRPILPMRLRVPCTRLARSLTTHPVEQRRPHAHQATAWCEPPARVAASHVLSSRRCHADTKPRKRAPVNLRTIKVGVWY